MLTVTTTKSEELNKIISWNELPSFWISMYRYEELMSQELEPINADTGLILM